MIQAFYMDRCHFCPSPESSKVICRSIQRKVKDFFSFFTCSMSARRESPSTLTLVAVQNPIRATPVGRPIHTIWNTSVRLPSRRCASLDCNGAAPCRRRDPTHLVTPSGRNICQSMLLRLLYLALCRFRDP